MSKHRSGLFDLSGLPQLNGKPRTVLLRRLRVAPTTLPPHQLEWDIFRHNLFFSPAPFFVRLNRPIRLGLWAHRRPQTPLGYFGNNDDGLTVNGKAVCLYTAIIVPKISPPEARQQPYAVVLAETRQRIEDTILSALYRSNVEIAYRPFRP